MSLTESIGVDHARRQVFDLPTCMELIEFKVMSLQPQGFPEV